MSIEL